ncbi:mechanosensitive ion channel family protein [Fusobacterium perfoetens]|uniref:mechanosensitive ion channel family protein n=1 Tax=Fusobacterium perfoetens TaxID=852 RepID=UPI001F2E1DED|nr:mechanosensitive ion channel domain-containing protein [Fusobacterium perfoetens]
MTENVTEITQIAEVLQDKKMHAFLNTILDSIAKALPSIAMRLLWVIFLLAIMKPVVNMVIKTLRAILHKGKADPLLESFLVSLVKTVVYIGFFFMIISGIGVQATSLVAILGTAGIAVGLALQGSLANLAGGVLILFFRPFLKGEFITTGAGSGTVTAIHILYTTLTTPDNKRIIIPNGQLANGAVTNISREPERRVDMVISTSYDTPVEKAKAVLQRIAEGNDKVLHEKGYTIRLNAHSASSLDYNFRVWTKSENYWEVYYTMMETVVIEFAKEGIEIPYQKIDIYNK